MGKLEGKVVLITGAARGQGRSHALRLAEEGADIVALDACRPFEHVPYAPATEEDLAETVKLVENLDRRVVSKVVDVRDLAGLEAAVGESVSELGRLDVVCANAGVASFQDGAWNATEEQWQEIIDIDLTGVWKTVKATVPTLLEQGEGGSIILTSSIAGLVGMPGLGQYVTAKHGVTGLMRVLAMELAPHRIRVNSVHPANVATPMLQNEPVYSLFLGGKAGATDEEAAAGMQPMNALPIPWLDARDISNMVAFLASDEAMNVTGTTQVVDAGATGPFRLPNS